jgi:hypothetical protein
MSEEKGFGVFKTLERQSPEVDHSRRSRGTRVTQFLTQGMEYFG